MSRIKALQYYITARLLLAPLMLFTITTLVFLLLRSTPGDPADAILGGRAPESAKYALRQQLGLNLPLWQQYFNYLGNLLKFDLGTSITSQGQNVLQIITQHFPATLELSVFSITVALIVGILIGTISAAKQGSIFDLFGKLFGIITYSLPITWVGMMGLLVFAGQLKWLPYGTRYPIGMEPPKFITGLYTIDSILNGNFSQFFASLHHLILPGVTLGILLSGIFQRIVRVNLQETLKSDYVEAARARGIPEIKILVSHALKNALIPVITVLGLTLASLLGGAVLTEVTFSWPGLGNRLYQAISDRDYPTVQGIMVFFGAIVVFASIIIDVLNAYIDPRIRY